MTWKRVVTALVLIPFVVAFILQRKTGWFPGGIPSLEMAFFLFVLGIAVLTLSTKRPLVETLPAAGISASGLLLVAFPLTFAIRLHGLGTEGPLLLLFALVITWVGDSAAYFVGRAVGKHPLAPHLRENMGRNDSKLRWFASGCRDFYALVGGSTAASARDGRRWQRGRTSRRSAGVGVQAQRRRERFRRIAARAWRCAGSHRRANSGDSRCLVLLGIDLLAESVGL